MEYGTTRYTMTLGELLETTDFRLFDFEYDFPTSDKPALENYIENYFYNDEIGMETPNRFKMAFITTFMQHLPLLNELVTLYDTADFSHDRLESERESLDETANSSNEGNQQASINSTVNSASTEQNTPVNPIGVNEQYASFKANTASDGNSSTTSKKTDNGTTTRSLQREVTRMGNSRNVIEIIETIQAKWTNPYAWLCSKLAVCFISLTL